MNKKFPALSTIAITAWVGGLWSIGYLAVPVLFHAQPDKQLAGLLAGEMFNALGYVGLVCSVVLLLHKFCCTQERFWQEKNVWIIVTMLVFSLFIQFGLSPVMANLKAQALPLDVMHSQFADRFKMLHGISSILYLLESLLGLYLVTKNQQ